jgi:hypothetical protein
MHRLENIVKKHHEFSPSVEKSKKEVEGETDYKAVIISLFFTVSALVCFFRKEVVSMGSSKKGSITMVITSCSIVLCPVLLCVRVSLCWLLRSFFEYSVRDTMSSSLFLAFDPDQKVLCTGDFLWSDHGFVGVSQTQNPEDVPVKKDRRAVSATWLPSFALVTLVLFILMVGGVSASKLRSWRMYPNINPWAIGKPSPRRGHKMVSGSDGALWVFGEWCTQRNGCRTSSDLFKLDLGAKEWTTITTSGVSPVARNSHTMTSTDGFLWVHGGVTGQGVQGEKLRPR